MKHVLKIFAASAGATCFATVLMGGVWTPSWGEDAAPAAKSAVVAPEVKADPVKTPSADTLAASVKTMAAGADRDAAIAKLQTMAASGDVAAMAVLGDIYREGKIVPQDLPKSLELYQQAAAKGNIPVLSKIAYLYYTSADVLKLDAAKALDFYQQGIDKGDASSMAGLGDIYREGKIVPQDLPKAASLYEAAAAKGNIQVLAKLGDLYSKNAVPLNVDATKAVGVYQQGADKGDPWAMIGLGEIYREGKIVPQDLPKALSLFEAAAAKGNTTVLTKLGDLYSRYATELNLDAAKSADFYQHGVDKGDPWAMVGLGDLYRAGTVVAQDLQKALDLYRMAADKGNTVASTRLGDLYNRSAAALKLDPTKAVDFYQIGADKGDSWAFVGLGDVYAEGKIMPADLPKALAYYQQAADKGNSVVFKKLGDLYYRNADVLKVDSAKAVDFYQQGADKGDSWAFVGLGDVYREGKIVPQDLAKALSSYEEAAALGNKTAFNKIGTLYYRDAAALNLNPADAIDYLRKGVDVGDPYAMASLGDVYREGKVVPRDYTKALGLYQSSYADGNARAYAAVVDVLLRGKPAEQKRGIAMLKTGLKENMAGLVPLWADAYISGRGVARNPVAGLKILKDATAKGDLPATLRLIQLYVQGYGGVIATSPKAALTLLASVKDKLPPERAEAERLFIAGVSARGPREMQAFVDDLKALPPGGQASVVGRISWNNQNTFVYALQTLMKESGAYTGPVNGLLTSSTAASFNKECTRLSTPVICGLGPLSDKVRPVLSDLFRMKERV